MSFDQLTSTIKERFSMRYVILLCGALCLSASSPAADIPKEKVRAAIVQAIPWLEKASAGSSKENKCFTCHNHALPVLALSEAKQRGFTVDEDNLSAQLQHILAHLKRGEQRYVEGKGQGGQVLTAGYALWALHVGGLAGDATTTAVTEYLLNDQSDKDHWTKKGTRPPSDGNEFTTTYVALRGLQEFTPEYKNAVKETRFSAVAKWLSATQPADTEDSVFRLKSLRIVQAEDAAANSAVEELLKQQRSDGGWAQKADMESDVYATGTVMAALLKTGEICRDHQAVKSGIQFLLDNQIDDGTWHVVTRADGFQPYYETGFPHGEDQFISVAASSWATMALLRSLPTEATSP
jgi:hypothetical protein